MGRYSVVSDKGGAGFFFLYSEEPRKREVAKFYRQADAEEARRALNSHKPLVTAIKEAIDTLNSVELTGVMNPKYKAWRLLKTALADAERGAR